MLLEINLVKTATIDSKVAKYIARQRYEVASDTEVLDYISKFIGENISTFTAALTDQRFVSALSSLNNLTIEKFNCLRYVIASKGLDVWVWYVKEGEANASEVSDNVFEYNVLDRFSTNSFVPMCFRVLQSSSENSLSKLYTEINNAYDLFGGSLFAGQVNPIMNMVKAMKVDEDAMGTVGQGKTTYVNSILEFIGLDIKVVTA